ncbi:34678_t:CDS:2 [Gigaspora margarita]|uniref:34678_t:CDS:1 n=1 Tax=Gigaspora margarita TaxID=4874 RepID=A0ABN7VXM7_GIGMA|nr:34678_t:CDS:2 [Gigaspora margarita]
MVIVNTKVIPMQQVVRLERKRAEVKAIEAGKKEINLKLEPDYFIDKRVENKILLEQVRSLQSRKEDKRVVIEEPSLELIVRIVEGQEKRQELKIALAEN